MNILTDLLIPALVFLVMGIVGTGLTLEDLRRVLVYPRAVVTATVAQIVLLPLLAVAFVRLTEPDEIIAAGLLLLVTCPGGAVSNSYTYLARANVALSVTLTATTSILSVLTMPVAIHLAFELGLGQVVHATAPISTITMQLAGLLVTPVAIGMLVRWKAPALVARLQRVFQAVTWIAILTLLAFVVWTERENLRAVVGLMMLFAVGFTLVAMALGLFVSRLSGCASPSDHITMMIEFSIRNLAIAMLVGASALGRTDFLIFSAAVFVAQTPLLVALVVWFRRRT